jgi:hypothetical protein
VGAAVLERVASVHRCRHPFWREARALRSTPDSPQGFFQSRLRNLEPLARATRAALIIAKSKRTQRRSGHIRVGQVSDRSRRSTIA